MAIEEMRLLVRLLSVHYQGLIHRKKLPFLVQGSPNAFCTSTSSDKVRQIIFPTTVVSPECN